MVTINRLLPLVSNAGVGPYHRAFESVFLRILRKRPTLTLTVKRDGNALPSASMAMHVSNKTRQETLVTERVDFDALPSELLFIIASHMSLVDKASFSLSRRSLLSTLGTQHFPPLRLDKDNNNKDRETFLLRLAKDLPALFLCFNCCFLHHRDAVSPPGPALWSRRILQCLDRGPYLGKLWSCVKVHRHRSNYVFAFPHLQLAIKRHYYGPDHGISTESLSLTEVQISDEITKQDQITTLLAIEARICREPPSLVLRIQQQAVVDSTDYDDILRRLSFVTLCYHITFDAPEVAQQIRRQLSIPLIRSERRSCRQLFKCRHCHTEFQLSLQDLEGKALAVVFTKWLDLGTGSTPSDLRWAAHNGAGSISQPAVLLEAGGLRERFESEPGLSQDQLSHRNSSLLISEAFKGSMTQWDRRTWILQGGRRVPSPYYDHRKNLVVFLLAFLPFYHFFIWPSLRDIVFAR